MPDEKKDDAPKKALNQTEAKNLRQLVENDFNKAVAELRQAFDETYRQRRQEVLDKYSPEDILKAQGEIAKAVAKAKAAYTADIEKIRAKYPDLIIGEPHTHTDGTLAYSPSEIKPFNVPADGYGVKVQFKTREQELNALKSELEAARNAAANALAVKKEEALRSVLVHTISSQEALDVLKNVPVAADVFGEQVKSIES